jgi:plasmid stabilization system protein ParE
VTPRLVFRPQALAELLEARTWYEDQRPGLGTVFAAAVDRTTNLIVQHPLLFARVHGAIRRAHVPGFPYGAYFRVSPEEIVVVAIMHGKRHPRRWQSRS